MKVIALYRTSTVAQELESQKREIVDMAIADGVKESDIIAIGTQGASAIKLDTPYLQQMEEVYSTIQSENVGCVYAWAIDRIGRNEEVLMKFKNTLIKNGVQLKIKNPSLTLLNADGSVNTGVELAFSLFATMAKQEMEQKQARFERARVRNMAAGKYIGGYLPFGYMVDDNGFFVFNEEEKEIVKLIFTLFNSGKYSTTTLAREMNERGYFGRDSKRNIKTPFNSAIISRILNCKTYTGEVTDKKGRKKTFPAIVSVEEQQKAKEILNNNNTKQPKLKTYNKHFYFASKLIVCSECGRHFQTLNNCYQCSGAIMAKREGTKHLSSCENHIATSITNLDGILWDITKREIMIVVDSDYSAATAEAEEKITVINQKISVLSAKVEEYDNKIDAVIENPLLTEAQVTKRIIKIREQQTADRNLLKSLEEEKERLTASISDREKVKRFFNNQGSLLALELNEEEKTMFDLVHEYINEVNVERSEYNGNKNYILITVKAKSGVYKIYFHGHKKLPKDRAFIMLPDTNEFVPYLFNRIIRTEAAATTEEVIEFNKFIEELKAKGSEFVSTDELIAEMKSNKVFEKLLAFDTEKAFKYTYEILGI